MDFKVYGAMGFGAVIGWYLYFINRYRKADVQIGDLTTVIGAVGGAAVLSIYDKGSDMFGAYGIGLAIGFFGYFVSLIYLVRHSKSFNADWFIDGRRPDPPSGWGYGPDAQQSVRAMGVDPDAAKRGLAPSSTQNFYFDAPSSRADLAGRPDGDAKTEIQTIPN